MIPAAFPGLPATTFPALFVPSLSAAVAGMTAVDITAAVAALVWAFGGLIALRIAIVMSQRDQRGDGAAKTVTPPDSGSGFRDAA